MVRDTFANNFLFIIRSESRLSRSQCHSLSHSNMLPQLCRVRVPPGMERWPFHDLLGMVVLATSYCGVLSRSQMPFGEDVMCVNTIHLSRRKVEN